MQTTHNQSRKQSARKRPPVQSGTRYVIHEDRCPSGHRTGQCRGLASRYATALNAGRHISLFQELYGLIRRRAASDGAHQEVVPASLQEHVPHPQHDATLAGHPGEFRMYAAMRRY